MPLLFFQIILTKCRPIFTARCYAMHSADYAVESWKMSVRPSVCRGDFCACVQANGGILSKRLNVLSNFFTVGYATPF